MKKQKERKQKGITLIALIITIIVMLILVGVTVSIALNGGLFKTAKQAVDKTKTASEEESGLKYEYEIAKATEGYTGTYEDYVLFKKYGLKIGDKIEYNEGTSGSYTTDASKGTGISYTSNTLNQGTYTVDGANDTVAAGDLEWVVLGVNDEGQVEIISTTPTTAKLTLYGKEGYLNAVTENGTLGTLDTFCNNLYGQGEGAISARSVALQDICKLADTEMQIDNTEYTFKYYDSGVARESPFWYIETEKITDENRNTTAGWSNSWNSSYSSLPTFDWILSADSVGPFTLRTLDYNVGYAFSPEKFESMRDFDVLNYVFNFKYYPDPNTGDVSWTRESQYYSYISTLWCGFVNLEMMPGYPRYGICSTTSIFYSNFSSRGVLFNSQGSVLNSSYAETVHPIVTLLPDASVLKQINE